MKTVLISGGSRGIGAALVRAFSKNGHRVAFFYHKSKGQADALALETGALALACDVSDPDAVRCGVAEVRGALGCVDILICNAGVSLIGLSRDTTDAEWRRVVDTNLSGAFYLAREVQGDMIAKQKGRIVMIGSMWGKLGASCEVAYSASKAGLRGLTLALAKELGPSGITVNCVEPGLIDTEMNASLDAETKAALVEETPLSRIGTTKDVVAAVEFFAGDAASFVTGQMLGVDGGFAL